MLAHNAHAVNCLKYFIANKTNNFFKHFKKLKNLEEQKVDNVIELKDKKKFKKKTFRKKKFYKKAR